MSIRVKRMGAWIVTLCMLLSLFPSPAALAVELEDDPEAVAVEAAAVEETEAAEEAAEEPEAAEEAAEEPEAAEEAAEEPEAAEEAAEEPEAAEEAAEEPEAAEEAAEEPEAAEEAAEDEAELLAASSKYVATLDELRAAIAAHEPDITLMGVAGDRMDLSGEPLLINYGDAVPGRKVVIDLGICNVYAQPNVPVFIVDNDTNLEITADQTPENNGRLVVGNFTAGAYPGGGGVYVKNGSLVLRGFTEIVPGEGATIAANGGAVYVDQDGASSKTDGPGAGLVMRQRASIHGFHLSGSHNGGAVYINGAGSFIMNGGGNDTGATGDFAIYDCSAVEGGAVYVNGGKFEMNADGGRNTILYENTATRGGAVFLNGGSFTMKGGNGFTSIIRDNHANNGGGVYQTGGGTFTIDSAAYTVANNNGALLSANDNANKSVVRIYGNDAAVNGGGVYVDGSTFQLAGGLIGVNRDENLDAQDGGTAVDPATAPDSEANTAGTSGGGVYLTGNGGRFILGNASKSGAIIGNRAGETDTTGNGGGIYVNGEFELYRGKIQGNALQATDGSYGFSNAFLAGVPQGSARQIDVKNALFGTGTKVYVTVEHFEQDPNKYSWQITKGTSYSDTNKYKEDSIQNDASKFIWPDNKDWAIALYYDYTVHADQSGDPTAQAEVAITLNQWRRLQHLIYLAVTGNLEGGNDIVGVQQDVFAQDYDKPLVVGVPAENTRQFRASDPADPNYFYSTEVAQPEITLDLHDYEVNRKLNYSDQEARTDGYAIEVLNGFTLTIKNETSTDSSLRDIGRITGGKMEGNGGGVIVREGGTVNLEAGFITRNQATRDGGGVYVENGGILNIKAVDKDTTGKISSNTAGRNGGGVYVDNGGIMTMEKGTIGRSANSEWSTGDSAEQTPTNRGNTAESNGGGVYVANGGTAILNTGAVRGNKANSTPSNNLNPNLYGGGGIYVDEGGTLTMVLNENVVAGDLNIAANTATRNGGGIYIASPNVNLSYGTIGNDNRAENGGGIYVALPCAAPADVLNTDGIIFNGVRVASNYATANGGGVYLAAFREDESVSTSRYRIGKLTMNSGVISGNHADSGLGGGIYLTYHPSTLNQPWFAAEFIMNDGSITGGNIATSGGGVYVPGETFKNADGTANVRGAAFTMVKGTISGNTASTTDGAGGVYAGNHITVRGDGAGSVNITGNTNGNVVLPNNNTTYARDIYEGTKHLATRRTIQQIYIAGDMNASQIGVTIKEGYGGSTADDCTLDQIVIFTEDFYQDTNADKNATRFASDTGLTSREGGTWLFQDDKDSSAKALTVPSSNHELNVAFLKTHHTHDRKTDPILETYRFKPIVPSFENNDILYYLDNGTMILQPGNYRLYSDLHFYTAQVKIPSGSAVNLCLNNRTVYLDDAFNNIEIKGVLRLFDDGPMEGDNNRTALGKGNFQHTAPITDADTLQGSFVTVDIEGAADKAHINDGFYMYGGTIHDLKATESIVKVGPGALYDLYGGVIKDCEVKTAVVNVDSGISTIFKLRGNVQTEIVNNHNTDMAHPEYGAIYVAGRANRDDTKGDLSNFWISDFAIRVSGNTNAAGNARNLYLGSPADGDAQYATVYVYGSFRVAQKQNGVGGKKEPIGVEVDPDVLAAIAAQPANTPNHDREYMFTYHYGRIVGEDLTNKEYTYNFISESDQYMVRPDRNSYANENQIFDGELRMVQHTHVWNFYRDEVTKRLYAYCEHQTGQADCDYTWELAAGNPIDNIEMVKQLMYKKDGEFVPANNTDHFVLRTGGGNTMTIKISDYFTHRIPEGKIDYLPEINAQTFIHIANRVVDANGNVTTNPTDPQNWLSETAGGNVTLTAGNEYTVVFLARYNDGGTGFKNSPCVEFNFTVSKDTVQRGDIDGDGELTLADAFKIQALADRIDFEDYTPSAAELALYDVTSPANPGTPDGKITAHDAIYIGDRAELLSVIDESLLEEEAPAAEGFVAFPVLAQKKTVTDPSEEATLLAAGDTVITVGGDTPPAGKPGDTVKLPVTIENLPEKGINGAVFDIGFNSNVLELTNVEPGLLSANGGSTFRHAFNYPDFVSQGHANRISWRNFSKAVTETGTLFTLEFRVLDGAAPGDYPVSMAVAGAAANFMSAGEAVSVTFNKGTVTVQKADSGEETPASKTTRLIVDNVSGKPGETVQMPIRIENNPGFRILYLTINYDKNVLTLKGLTPNSALTDGDYKDHWTDERLAVNRLRFVSYEGAVQGDITLVTAEFEIAAEAAFGPTSVSLEITTSPDNFYTGSATITPEFVPGTVSVLNDNVQYTVTWANNDGSTLSTALYYAGETPAYSGTTPTRVAPEGETLEPGTQYVFAGWDPAPASLTGNMTYTAKYEKKTQTFQVTWYDEDGTTVLITSEVPYGQTPSYPANGPTLTKDADPESVYAFAGWDPAPAPVTSGNVSYKATYTTEARTYTITYNVTDVMGAYTHSQTLPYGSDPAAAYNGPKGYTDAEGQDMVLIGWEPAPVAVTASTAYTALYTVSTKEDMKQEPTAEFNEDLLTLKNLPTDAGEVTVTVSFTDASNETQTLDPQTVPVNEAGEATVRLLTPAGSNQQFTVKIESDKYADKTITAKAPAALFTVRFVDYAGENIIAQAVYADGTKAADIEVPSSVPAKVTDRYICAFTGWDKEIADVTGDATYTAVYQSEDEATPRTFTITWMNDDNTVLRTDKDMEYGSTPNYGGEPSKANPAAGYTYTFIGWTPSVSSVTGDATYTAQYDSGIIQTFTITWKDEDGTILRTDENVAYGTMPVYGTDPVKTAADKIYTFTGWTPNVTAVNGNAEYTATYDAGTVKTFPVTFTWKNDKGEDVSDSQNYLYGTKAADIKAPSVPALTTASHIRAFIGWNPQVADVTEAASYSAVYQSESEATLRTFTVTFSWLDSSGKEASQSESYAYGTPAADIRVPAVPNRETADAVYTFTGWDNPVANVTENMSYVAQYNVEQKAAFYTIIWKDMDGTELKRDENAASGTVPAYDGPTPSMTAEGYTYTWTGWTPAVVSVTADATYTATYDIVKNTYTVMWMDGNGNILEEDRNVEHGATPTFDGEYPVKTDDEGNLYPFKEWSPAVGAITGDTDYIAVYEDEPLSSETFTLTIHNGTGSGTYRAGERVKIYATVPSGKTFSKWTTPFLPVGFTLPTERNAVITMPATDLQLTANFKSSNGCYVATAVYGSYDCPEVWTLRRFRDNVLAKSWYGRLFISLYYAISPTAVRLFGQSQWFHNLFHGILDPWVANLQANGFESTPYKDLDW